MRKGSLIFVLLVLVVFWTACSSVRVQNESTAPTVQAATTAAKGTAQSTAAATEQVRTYPVTQNAATEPAPTEAVQEQTQNNKEPEHEEEQSQEIQNGDLQMMIGDTSVSVTWENNEAVQALRELCRYQPLTIYMSMYGDFEQVGSIGSDLPQNNELTTTSAGDIVLYSGNQMVVFYGSNTWAYTRLGHIIDKTPEELTVLLSNGNVTITLTY